MNLSKFNYDALKDNFRMIVFGASGSGKTTFVKSMLNNNLTKYYKNIFIVTPKFHDIQYKNIKTNGSKICYIGTKDTSEILGFLKELQRQRYNRIYDKNENGMKFKDKVLVIFDDIINDKLVRNSSFSELFGACRHLDISLIFLIQDISTVVSQFMKNNSSHFVLFSLRNIKRNRDFIFDAISVDSRLDTKTNKELKEIKNSLYNKHIATRYQCIVCDNFNRYIYFG